MKDFGVLVFVRISASKCASVQNTSVRSIDTASTRYNACT